MKKFILSKSKVNAKGNIIPQAQIFSSHDQKEIMDLAFNADCDTIISCK